MKIELKKIYLAWKRYRWERGIESVTTAKFYHVSEKDIEELEKILDDARERIRDKEKKMNGARV